MSTQVNLEREGGRDGWKQGNRQAISRISSSDSLANVCVFGYLQLCLMFPSVIYFCMFTEICFLGAG